MNVGKIRDGSGVVRIGVVDGETVALGPTNESLSGLLFSDDPWSVASAILKGSAERISAADAVWLAPIDHQQVWAAGVTYTRSRQARMEESESAARFYDKVYQADRPELFFKATPDRVANPNEPVRVRSDSRWSVPEPEWTLAVTPTLRVVGYTAGNDMSARDIEGENPLYLPQAKVYRQCTSLGPTIRLCREIPNPADLQIRMEIVRDGQAVFTGETSVGALKRTPTELVDWLGAEDQFDNGVFLLTGTGIVPPDDFTLKDGDIVHIDLTGVGRLTNPVVQGAATKVRPTP